MSNATSAAARLTACAALLAAGVALQPVALDVLRPLLCSFAEQPFPALVQLVRLEAFLLRHRNRVTVLAVLGGESGGLRLRHHLRGRKRRDGHEGREKGAGCNRRDGHALRIAHGPTSFTECVV